MGWNMFANDWPMSSAARKDYQHRYYLANRTKFLAQAKRNYAANRDRRRAQARQRYLTDDVAVMLDRARQRARERGLPFSITRADITIPTYCPVFGRPMA